MGDLSSVASSASLPADLESHRLDRVYDVATEARAKEEWISIAKIAERLPDMKDHDILELTDVWTDLRIFEADALEDCMHCSIIRFKLDVLLAETDAALPK